MRKLAKWIGLSSVLLSLATWTWWIWAFRARIGVWSHYEIVGVAGSFGLASILAILAASLGSRWWLLALLPPLYGLGVLFLGFSS